MDDRNLVAVAEQAAGPSRVLRGPIAGCTIKADDGRVFLGCMLEFEDPSADIDPIANGIATGCVEGMRRVARIGFYSPTEGQQPQIPTVTLLRLKEMAVPGLAIIFSTGNGARVEKSLEELLLESGIS